MSNHSDVPTALTDRHEMWQVETRPDDNTTYLDLDALRVHVDVTKDMPGATRVTFRGVDESSERVGEHGARKVISRHRTYEAAERARVVEPASEGRPPVFPRDLPRGAVAYIGHRDNDRLIVKTNTDLWRSIDDGRAVDPEDFRGGWDVVSLPGERD